MNPRILYNKSLHLLYIVVYILHRPNESTEIQYHAHYCESKTCKVHIQFSQTPDMRDKGLVDINIQTVGSEFTYKQGSGRNLHMRVLEPSSLNTVSRLGR